MQVFSFPFYDSKLKQNRFSSVCARYQDYDLFSEPNRFLPFMVRKPKDGILLECIKVFNLADELVKVIIPEDFNYRMFSDAVNDYVFYYGGLVENMVLACGKYYLQVADYFSEVFTVHHDVSKLLKLEWQHSGNVGEAIYYQGFYQRLYLDTVLADPKYKIDQEGDENGNNEFVPTFTKVTKKYHLETVLLPEFLVDVLHTLAAHNEVKIGNVSGVQQIEADADWLVSGCLATVQLTFQQAESVFSKNCSDQLQLVEVDQSNYAPLPWGCGESDTTDPYWLDTGEFRCIKGEPTEVGKAWRPVDPYCETI